uniref:Sulphur transport domain-containing protein n=1 Tax=Rhodosorus marinus TaxID=101924 RepID=A0A7S3EKC0_9RHOD|mmetsp:Transcript_4044/g.16940  ORF Transcript_4044/g.16940 Transcript_4044/m.16940 type:complete len:330 (+) Transcript_4044:163-1152(+)|eukprot:CAMPEP_0113964158 /NCGR_PEP_ID=MMETSP0011_2-20120614/6958_1 /TAXON_ID=101924 /ORGANISM="Rhodosorus marinus" /LENGTH=329 /DNA_ID=CAMNT_0000976377 /DNA_START=10 /DNA_END=999 /DNA_ORIENTATION=+ /assembly_acc=CAM_ASM_000156
MKIELVKGLLGGGLMAVATSSFLALTGRLIGLSGIFASVLKPSVRGFSWKAAFTSGLMLGSLVTQTQTRGDWVLMPFNGMFPSWFAYIVGGFLVGFGTRLANGCTSGHGLSGIARFSARSTLATITFLGTGIATATMIDALGGGPFRNFPDALDQSNDYLRWFAAVGAFGLLIRSVGLSMGDGNSLINVVVPFGAGATFGAGLTVSAMITPEKLLGFLTMTDFETWDATLMVVFATGVALNSIFFKLILSSLERPVLAQTNEEPKFEVPTNNCDITRKLILGSLIFGAGMGISGACPGPGLVLKTMGMPKGWAYTISMYAGFEAVSRFQ